MEVHSHGSSRSVFAYWISRDRSSSLHVRPLALNGVKCGKVPFV